MAQAITIQTIRKVIIQTINNIMEAADLIKTHKIQTIITAKKATVITIKLLTITISPGDNICPLKNYIYSLVNG